MKRLSNYKNKMWNNKNMLVRRGNLFAVFIDVIIPFVICSLILPNYLLFKLYILDDLFVWLEGLFISNSTHLLQLQEFTISEQFST